MAMLTDIINRAKFKSSHDTGKWRVQSVENANLMEIVVLIPEIFLEFIIWEYPEIEHFDIGLESLWLKCRQNEINVMKKYSVHKTEPDPEEDCVIKYFDKFYLHKATYPDGTLTLDMSYKERILRKLNPPTFVPRFVCIEDNGEILKGDNGEIVYFELSADAMKFNRENGYKYQVMQEIPEMDFLWKDGRLSVYYK